MWKSRRINFSELQVNDSSCNEVVTICLQTSEWVPRGWFFERGCTDVGLVVLVSLEFIITIREYYKWCLSYSFPVTEASEYISVYVHCT